MSADTPRRLGRGLEALISTAKQQRDTGSVPVQSEAAPAGSDLKQVRIADILPNRFQPRRAFSEPELAELEASIEANGLLQPIVGARAGRRQLGARRWRASAYEPRADSVGPRSPPSSANSMIGRC